MIFDGFVIVLVFDCILFEDDGFLLYVIFMLWNIDLGFCVVFG